nr:MATH domain and coiled-coil domain-containing protein At2g01790-like [Ipomoea batatas]
MGDSAAGGVEMLKRDISPANFIFMIRSFSLLSETGNEKHESGIFQACDKKWKLCVYPKGKKKQQQQADNEDAHISLYLQIVDTHNFPLGWVVHAKFSLFVYNHVEDKYFTLKDSGGEKVRRFHYMKTEWGFDQLLPLSIFNDPSNGYLVDDTCAFGAEIVVASNATKGECLSLVKDPEDKKYTWRISGFASKQREQQVIYSDEFTIEGSTWKLQVFPKGDSSAKDKNLSLFLESVDSSNLTVNNGRRLYAKYKLRICNQLKPGEDQEKEGYYLSLQI